MTIDELNIFIKDQDKNSIKIDKEINKHNYETSPSFIKNNLRIKNVLMSEKISLCKIKRIISQLTYFSIPAGTKGSIRGLAFNKMVGKMLKRLVNKKKYITLKFEAKHPLMSEKADWMLINNNNKKVLIGYNQLDLWHGGAQINRASKYILDEVMHQSLSKKRIKVLSVVARIPTPFKSTKNKTYHIFDVGLRKKRLFYLEGLKNFVAQWL